MFYVTATKSLFSIRIAKIGFFSIKSKGEYIYYLMAEINPAKLKTLKKREQYGQKYKNTNRNNTF